MESLPGDGHVLAAADLRDPAAVRAMVDGAAAALGGIDVLVNNAGIFVAHPITTVSYEEWQQAWQDTLGVNLVGAANVTWCAVRHMPTDGGGRIVNVSSRGAFRGEPGPACLRREQGRAHLLRPVARPRPRRPTHRRDDHCPGLHRDGHGRRDAGWSGRRSPARGEPDGSRRDPPGGRAGGALSRLSPGRVRDGHGAGHERRVLPADVAATKMGTCPTTRPRRIAYGCGGRSTPPRTATTGRGRTIQSSSSTTWCSWPRCSRAITCSRSAAAPARPPHPWRVAGFGSPASSWGRSWQPCPVATWPGFPR